MLRMIIVLTVNEEADVAEVRGLLAEQGRLSRQEPGCRRFEVYHSQSDPKVFVLCEWWDSQETLDVHRTARAYTEIYQPKVLPRVSRVPHISTLVE
jgi:quinol monooxygenase YgiN